MKVLECISLKKLTKILFILYIFENALWVILSIPDGNLIYYITPDGKVIKKEVLRYVYE